MKTNSPRPAYFRLQSSLVASLFITMLFITNPSTCLAQAGQAPPVARLLSSSVVNAVTRPRRVSQSSSLVNSEAGGAVEAAPLPIEEATPIERTAFDKTNEARVKNGLLPLEWDGLLCRMARMHSQDMAQRGYFAHENREGQQPRDRGRALGIGRFRVLGENIAYNKGLEDPGGFAVERWMTSSGHRANILHVGFQASAIGSYVAADGSVYLTQIFITR